MRRTWLLLSLLTVILFLTLDSVAAGPFSGPSTLQYIFFPVVAGLLLMLQLGRRGYSRLIVLLAFGAFALAGQFLGPRTTAHANSFMVGTLLDDSLGGESRRFREMIKDADSPHGRGKIVPHFSTVTGSGAAQELLRSASGASAIVWQRGSRLVITFAEPPAESAYTAIAEAGRAVAGAKPILWLPEISVALEPRTDAAAFLARLLAVPGLDLLHLDSSADWLEAGLAEAGTFMAPWRSLEHRAYAAWRLGNLHLARYLSSAGAQEEGYLRCAAAAYQRAAKMIRPKDSRLLYASILNNLVVVQRASSSTVKRKPAKRAARKKLRYALRLLGAEHEGAIRGTVAGNLRSISGKRRANSGARAKTEKKRKHGKG